MCFDSDVVVDIDLNMNGSSGAEVRCSGLGLFGRGGGCAAHVPSGTLHMVRLGLDLKLALGCKSCASHVVCFSPQVVWEGSPSTQHTQLHTKTALRLAGSYQSQKLMALTRHETRGGCLTRRAR